MHNVLDYARPRPIDPPNNVGPLLVTALHLPGSYCWFMWIQLWLGFEPPPALVILAWPLAVCAAIVSLGTFIPASGRRNPWYVWLNLAINISGLIFTAVVPICGESLFGLRK